MSGHKMKTGYMIVFCFFALMGCDKSGSDGPSQADLLKVENERNDLKMELGQLQGSLEQVKDQLSVVADARDNLQTVADESKAKLGQMQADLKSALDNVATLGQAKEDAVAQAEKAKAAMESIKSQLAEKTKMVTDLQAQIEKFKAKTGELEKVLPGALPL